MDQKDESPNTKRLTLSECQRSLAKNFSNRPGIKAIGSEDIDGQLGLVVYVEKNSRQADMVLVDMRAMAKPHGFEIHTKTDPKFG